MFESAVTVLDGMAVVHLSGELDVSSVDEALAVTLGVIDAGHTHVVIDLSSLRFICSAGVSVLLAARRAMQHAGGVLTVRHPTASVERVLDLLQLDTIIDIRHRTPETQSAARLP